MDGNSAGWFASDAVADGRNSQNLRGPGATGILESATSGIGAAARDDCTAPGGGDTRGTRTADPALDFRRFWAATYSAGLVGIFLSCRGVRAGACSADGDLSSGTSGGGTDGEPPAGGAGGDVAVVVCERAIRILCPPGAIQHRLWGAGGCDRVDGVDAAFGGDCISWGGVECGADGKPTGRGAQWLNSSCAWNATPATRRTSDPCASYSQGAHWC